MATVIWLTRRGRTLAGEVVATVPPRTRPVDLGWTKRAAQDRFRRVAGNLSGMRLVESWLVSVPDSYGRLPELHWPDPARLGIGQPGLIAGYYRCQACLRDVERVVRVQQFRLCPDCRDQCVPHFPQSQNRRGEWGWCARTPAERAEVERYLGNIRKLEEMYGIPLNRSGRDYRGMHRRAIISLAEQRAGDACYPLCDCGQPRQAARIGTPGLFGGPFLRYCEACDLRRQIEMVAEMADQLMPGRDDEDWLDVLYQSHHRAFELKILPDLWWQVRRGGNINGDKTAL